MMSPVATRIYEKIQTLTREKDELHNRIKKMTQDKEAVKRSIHRTEMVILTEGAVTSAIGVPDIQLANEMRELKKEQQTLQADDRELKELTAKHTNISKTIESYQFWMHYADSSDIARQKEAEKKVFG